MVAAPLTAQPTWKPGPTSSSATKIASLRARARDGDARADAAAAALEQAQIVATLLQLRLARWQYARFSPGGFGGLDLGYSSAKSKIEGALAQLRPGLFRPPPPPDPRVVP